jgi:hypothetical protein
MACSSKPNKLWSSMSAILCRGLICCFDNMVPKWHYLWLDDIFCFGFLYQIHSPAKFATEIWCPVCFMLADLLVYYHCLQCYHQCVFKRNTKLNLQLAAYTLNHSSLMLGCWNENYCLKFFAVILQWRRRNSKSAAWQV